ncbi:hypothetical protein BCR41DRAFT_357404, partial [Lobosporangium transversale]
WAQTTTSRRAKVASMAQMDISSIPLTTKPITTRGSSNSVATTASFRSSNGTSNSNSNHTNSNRKDGGSVTSDDGTVSEDSDLTRDDILHLLSGGQAGVAGGISLPFDGSSRHSNSTSTSKVGVVGAGSGGSTGRPRTGEYGWIHCGHISVWINSWIKPFILIASRGWKSHNNNNNNSYTSGGGGDDASSAISVNSTVSTSTHLTTRSNKGNISAAAAANAAANKQAEDSRPSLLSINQSLETTVRKQASRVQELETRLQSDDQVFKRLCFSIEQMICEAKQALDQATKSTGMRVFRFMKCVKGIAETEESIRDDAEDQDDDDTQSVDQDQEEHGTSNRYSIEATRQYEDSTGQKLQNSNPNGENNRSSLASPLSNKKEKYPGTYSAPS